MGVTNRHGLYAVKIGEVVLGGITAQNVATGTEARGEAASDEVYPQIQSIVAQKPSAGFTTLAIAAALDAVGLLGVNIADLTGLLVCYARKHKDGGTREPGAAHRSYTINNGILIPRTLSCEHQGDATLTYEALVTYDGTNEPVIVADSVTLPVGTANDERFSLGPVTIGGVTITSVRSLQIDFGINAVTEGADSDIWDTLVSIRNIKPTITLRGIELAWFHASGIPLTAKVATHLNTQIILRKRAAGGTFVVPETAEHISFTAAGMAYIDAPMNATGEEPGEVSLMMPLIYDGTNDPVVIDTTAAY
jgi:hypothetical protein